MRRREFLKLSAAGAATTVLAGLAHGEDGTVGGRVTAGGKGLAKVIVSDGLTCTMTDRNGAYRLPRRAGARFVTVSVPCGHQVKGHWRKVEATVGTYDFELEKSAAGEGKCGCRFVQVADSELSEDNAQNRKWIAEVRQIATRNRCAFIVHTGDICYLKGMQVHAELMNTGNMGLPVVYCAGNHDLVAGDYGEQAFEEIFGPSWYSFNAGGIHFLVVPMVGGCDFKPRYTEDELADWMRADLGLVGKKKPVIVFSHMLFHPGKEDEVGLVIGKERPLNLKSVCNFKGFVYGHVHNAYTSRNGGVTFMCSTNPNFGGIDHSPELLRVFDVKADGSFVTENHYGRNPERTWQTSRGGAAWERRMPSPVLFATPVVADGKVFVGTTDDENRGTGQIVALDAKTGAIVWKRKVGNSIKNRFAVASGNVIAQDADGCVYAFATGSGKTAWKLRLPFHFQVLASAVTASADGKTAYVGYGSRLTAVDAATGTVKWQGAPWGKESVAGGPGIGEGRMVWAANWEGLECHDLESGKHLWALTGEPWRFPGSDPLIADGKVIAACQWQIAEADLKTGRTLRVKKLGVPMGLPSGPILAVGGRYLVGSHEAGLLAIDRETLEIAWRAEPGLALLGVGAYRKPGKAANTSPVLADEKTVCAACADGTIRFWDMDTGKEKRKIVTGAPYLAGVAVADGRLFAADMAGCVRMFALGN